MQHFQKTSRFPVSAAKLFSWHERPGAFERLNPPWQPVTVISHTGGIRDGARVRLRIPIGPLGITWELGHKDYIPGKQFRDYQISGPFSSWEHTHRIESIGDAEAELSDLIEYKLPLGILGAAFDPITIGSDLKRVFEYRHTVTRNDLALLSKYPIAPKKILISGASGLVGSSLVSFLSVAGHSVSTLVRRAARENSSEIFWDPELKKIDPAKLEGFDAVIHLSGENVAGGRWTESRKQAILESRTKTTQFLVDTLRTLSSKPETFLCASAIGYYGNRDDELLSEESSAGCGFLVEVAKAWESIARQTETFGVRSVSLRFGIILSPRGGALTKMLPPFQLGAGGVVGSGLQYMSWIALDDVIGSIYHVLATEAVRGPINVVAPRAATNLEFTKTLGSVLRRPTLAPVPAFAIKLLFGQMGEALILGSTRVAPKKLLSSGYQFLFPTLESAMRHLLGRTLINKEGGSALRDALPPS